VKRATWLDLFGGARDGRPLPAKAREALSRLDDTLFDLWNLGENILLAWTNEGKNLRLLAVRHYALAQAMQSNDSSRPGDSINFINELLAGPKWLAADQFGKVCVAFDCEATAVHVDFQPGKDVELDLVSSLVHRYGVSLVRDRAVVLLDAVQFSLRPPLEQVVMLNSLGYSVNSAYRQLLSKDIEVNFARTTTGDGFYIWNRVKSVDANIALYKLMMMILADNAVAQSKAQGGCVPQLRAAFHIGEHYEFHQVEALNPTTFSYIVGQVTIDLSRIVEKALPGQILLGDFEAAINDAASGGMTRYDTLDFVEKTAATLDELRGLDISGDRIENIRCYLTGQETGGGRYPVNRYLIHDKHGMPRVVYNAKINIHREHAEPIYLGNRREDLVAFQATRVDMLDRDPG
jgi:hypothetical protein